MREHSGAEARLDFGTLWRHEWNSRPSRNLPQGLKPPAEEGKASSQRWRRCAIQKRTVRHAPTQANCGLEWATRVLAQASGPQGLKAFSSVTLNAALKGHSSTVAPRLDSPPPILRVGSRSSRCTPALPHTCAAAGLRCSASALLHVPHHFRSIREVSDYGLGVRASYAGMVIGSPNNGC
jgi:hypothetical protein